MNRNGVWRKNRIPITTDLKKKKNMNRNIVSLEEKGRPQQ